MPLLAAGVLTLSAAQLLDLATFVTMVRSVGPDAEANPLVVLLFVAYGFPMVAIVKILLVSLVTAIVALLLGSRPRPRLAAAILAVGIAVGLVGGLSNSAVLATVGVRLLA